MAERTPSGPDIDSHLPSDEEVYDEVFRSPNDPVGINLGPALTGWLSVDGIDEKDWLTRPPLKDFDPRTLNSTRIVVYPPGEDVPATGEDAAAQRFANPTPDLRLLTDNEPPSDARKQA